MRHMTNRTTDHEIIETWAEARGGRPVIVAATRTGEGDSESGLLRIDFGEKDGEFEEISWEEFFRIFDENSLAFLYQEETDEGEESKFCKFVERTEEDEIEEDVDVTDDVDEL
jgi:hypothetical protein